MTTIKQQAWAEGERAQVRLYHATTDAGRAGIEADGFAISHVGDSEGQSWFRAWKANDATPGRGTWWVIVTLPDDVAEQHVYPPDAQFDIRLRKYRVPWDVLNAHRPFEYEPKYDHPTPWNLGGFDVIP
ncbi:hypothetical protein [Promicromonospora soli]